MALDCSVTIMDCDYETPPVTKVASQIEMDDLIIDRCIGEGAFCQVYKIKVHRNREAAFKLRLSNQQREHLFENDLNHAVDSDLELPYFALKIPKADGISPKMTPLKWEHENFGGAELSVPHLPQPICRGADPCRYGGPALAALWPLAAGGLWTLRHPELSGPSQGYP